MVENYIHIIFKYIFIYLFKINSFYLIIIIDPSKEETRIKKEYITENNSQYLWPEKTTVRESYGVDNKLSCKDNIFPTDESFVKKENTSENKSQYVWPEKSEKRESIHIDGNRANIFPVNLEDKTPIVANITESKSSYSWPGKVAKLNRSNQGGEIKNCTNCIVPVDTTTTTIDPAYETYMSNDSLEPVRKEDQTIIETITTHKDSRPSAATPSFCSSRPSMYSSKGESRSFDMNSLGNSVGHASSVTLSLPASKSKKSLQMEAITAADKHSAKQNMRRNMIKNPRNLPRNSNVNQSKRGEKFNPVLYHKRYPPNSDRQIGRWTTETRAAFTTKNPICAQ
jgi:hypothetical protein